MLIGYNNFLTAFKKQFKVQAKCCLDFFFLEIYLFVASRQIKWYNLFMGNVEFDLNKQKVREMQPLALAFIGDSVHTLFVREHLAKSGDYKVNQLTRMTKEFINAGFQCRVFKEIEPLLSEEEHDIAMRARNTAKGQTAKNYSVSEYNYATAFEALIGFLYLTGQSERLNQILNMSIMEK